MTGAKPKKKGRPSLYTEPLAAKICRRLAEGETLRSVCRDKAMPDKATVLRWLGDKTKADFRDQYAHARDMQGPPDLALSDVQSLPLLEQLARGDPPRGDDVHSLSAAPAPVITEIAAHSAQRVSVQR